MLWAWHLLVTRMSTFQSLCAHLKQAFTNRGHCAGSYEAWCVMVFQTVQFCNVINCYRITDDASQHIQIDVSCNLNSGLTSDIRKQTRWQPRIIWWLLESQLTARKEHGKLGSHPRLHLPWGGNPCKLQVKLLKYIQVKNGRECIPNRADAKDFNHC